MSYTENSNLSPVTEDLAAVVGESRVIQDAERIAPFLEERRGNFRSQAHCVVLPGSTEEVSAVVAVCRNHRVPIIPQGGNTGLCGGAVSQANGVVVSLNGMNRIRNIDPVGYTMEAEAGCILANLQTAARESNLYLPLSLGAEGTCQIGGNLSTNAGGVNVLRYGNARDLTLGLELVLPNSEIWHGLNALRKNNTGYDLKNLFIGAEGTLGIITAAVLKLFPLPVHRSTALIALDSIENAVDLYAKSRRETSDAALSFELMSRLSLECAFNHFSECRDPFPEPYAWYVLMELGDSTRQGFSRELNHEFLESAIGEGLVLDAVFATNEKQVQDLWRLREAIVEAQKYEGRSIKNDISVPLSNIVEFINSATEEMQNMTPGVRCFVFGHIGDGNIHFNLSQPKDMDSEKFYGRWNNITAAINRIVIHFRGSFSAEHGIGILKTGEMASYKSSVELGLMRTIKSALDPDNIMNPGKVLPDDSS